MVTVLATKITSHHDTPIGGNLENNQRQVCSRCGIKSNRILGGRCRDCRSVECPNGHLLTPENSKTREYRSPECLTCKTRRDKNRNRKKAKASQSTQEKKTKTLPRVYSMTYPLNSEEPQQSLADARQHLFTEAALMGEPKRACLSVLHGPAEVTGTAIVLVPIGATAA